MTKQSSGPLCRRSRDSRLTTFQGEAAAVSRRAIQIPRTAPPPGDCPRLLFRDALQELRSRGRRKLDFPHDEVPQSWRNFRDLFADDFRFASSSILQAVTRTGRGYRQRRNYPFNPLNEHKFPPRAATSCHI